MQQTTGEPGNGQSRSANYIFDHGTTWISSGGGGGGGGGSSGGGGGGTGIMLIQDNGIGGVSPAVDTADSAEVAKEIPRATGFAVRQSSAPAAVQKVIKSNNSTPHIIRIVDENNVVRALAIVLMKRVIPWPWWIALALIIMGIILFFIAIRQKFTTSQVVNIINEAPTEIKYLWLLWLGVGLITLGIALFVIARFFYQANFEKFDARQTTTAMQVSLSEATIALKKIMHTLPVGVHRLSIINMRNQEEINITIVVKPILAI